MIAYPSIIERGDKKENEDDCMDGWKACEPLTDSDREKKEIRRAFIHLPTNGTAFHIPHRIKTKPEQTAQSSARSLKNPAVTTLMPQNIHAEPGHANTTRNATLYLSGTTYIGPRPQPYNISSSRPYPPTHAIDP